MHNNYYFLRHLSSEVEKKIKGFTLVSCFSQNKDELVIEFNNGKKSFFIKANLQPTLPCLTFPEKFHRAKKNSIDLFNDLLMLNVKSVRQFSNERSFGIALEGDHFLVFKMHGNQANVIWFTGDIAQKVFRNNLKADLALRLSELDRRIDWSFENFKKNQADLEKIYFTFGKPVWNYLNEHQFQKIELDEKWKLLKDTLVLLNQSEFFIIQKGTNHLSLLSYGEVLDVYTDPIEAVNTFYTRSSTTSAFDKEKSSLLSGVRGKIKQSLAYLKKTEQKLAELESHSQYQQWADLIMAHLYEINPEMEKVSLQNFYDENRYVEIPLKKNLSPQKNAEVYYNKSKNQSIEIKNLKELLAEKQKVLGQLKQQEEKILSVHRTEDLKILSPAEKSPKEKTALPYFEFEFKGFKILVGRNAVANDTLTLKVAYKEDLWLHAKDVSGSHVVIKHQSGKKFPKDVIERAAQLAAFYSKRKNESLCPVTVTPKKFVRKKKGDPPGAVVVEREDVVMVEPVNGKW